MTATGEAGPMNPDDVRIMGELAWCWMWLALAGLAFLCVGALLYYGLRFLGSKGEKP
jgi:hypothetical protein